MAVRMTVIAFSLAVWHSMSSEIIALSGAARAGAAMTEANAAAVIRFSALRFMFLSIKFIPEIDVKISLANEAVARSAKKTLAS
jgi:hypothetical protein